MRHHGRCNESGDVPELPVSSAGIYAWRKRVTGREPSGATQRRADLLVRIMSIHKESAGAYGSPRVTAELRDDGSW